MPLVLPTVLAAVLFVRVLRSPNGMGSAFWARALRGSARWDTYIAAAQAGRRPSLIGLGLLAAGSLTANIVWFASHHAAEVVGIVAIGASLPFMIVATARTERLWKRGLAEARAK
ncbi:MAG: hypothetical protein ABR520_05095 [Mycobacteriales bacterium]|nr:hypothetical protein [Frankia sp.]